MSLRPYRIVALTTMVAFAATMVMANIAKDTVLFGASLLGAGLAGLGYLFLTEGTAPMPDKSTTYRALAQRLRWEIREESIQPGQMLPSVAHYAMRFGTTHKTVRRALWVLADEGLVRIEPRKGTFVTAGNGYRPGRALPAARVEKVLRRHIAEGTPVAPAPALAANLQVSESTVRRVLRKLGIRRKGGEGGSF